MKWIRRALFVAALLSLLVSLFSFFANHDFWGFQSYEPFLVKAAIWYVAAAGPLAIWLSRRRPWVSTVIIACQATLIVIASIYPSGML